MLTEMVHWIPSTRSMPLDPETLGIVPYSNFSVLSVAGHTIVSPLSRKGQVKASLTSPPQLSLIQLPFHPDHLDQQSPTLLEESDATVAWEHRSQLTTQMDHISTSYSMASTSLVLVILSVTTAIGLIGHYTWRMHAVKKAKKAEVVRMLTLLSPKEHVVGSP